MEFSIEMPKFWHDTTIIWIQHSKVNDKIKYQNTVKEYENDFCGENNHCLHRMPWVMDHHKIRRWHFQIKWQNAVSWGNIETYASSQCFTFHISHFSLQSNLLAWHRLSNKRNVQKCLLRDIQSNPLGSWDLIIVWVCLLLLAMLAITLYMQR